MQCRNSPSILAICLILAIQGFPMSGAAQTVPDASVKAAPMAPAHVKSPRTAPAASLSASMAPIVAPTTNAARKAVTASRRTAEQESIKQASTKASAGASCPASLGPAEQIVCLQTQNAILKQQIEHQDLSKKLGGADTRRLDMPVVLSTFGIGGKSRAVLSWAGSTGGALTVKVGDQVPGGWTVAGVDQGRVTIRQGNLKHILLLSGNVSGDSAGEMPSVISTSALGAANAPAFPGFSPSAPAPGSMGGQQQ